MFFPVSNAGKTTGSAGFINSIQNFSITIGNAATSNTATITSVNTANSIIIFDGWETSDTSTNPDRILTAVTLTNGTTVTATRNTQNNTDSVIVKGQVVEFKSAKLQSAVQYGTITIAAASTSNTATITSVNTANAVVLFLGWTTTDTTSNTNAISTLALTNGTTVTASRVGTTNSATVGFVVVEFVTGVVNSIQVVSNTDTSANLSYTSTITSVVTANTLLLYNGAKCGNLTNFGASGSIYAALTNSTTVTFTRTGNSATSRTQQYTVLEFVSGVLTSKQTAQTLMSSGNASATATVTSVNTAKAVLNYCFFDTSGGNNTSISDAVLTNATTVTVARNSGTATTSTVSWELVEFT